VIQNTIAAKDSQITFAENDRVEGKPIPFTNGLDKGYRAKMAAWRNGKQIAIQTIYAGCVAHNRSGNERGVNVCKRSGLFQRGFRQGMCPKRMQNAWRTWSYRANFMYKPVV